MNVMAETATRRSPGTPPIVILKGIAKYFPGVIANQDVDLEVWGGEIHALLGENGAGKSTLMNILTGIYKPDAGEIIIDGYARGFASPVEAIAAGIGMVHQHFKLVKAFTVAENIHLGWSETPPRISAEALEARTAELAVALNLVVKPDARVEDLSTGEQQRVEILRLLTRQPRRGVGGSLARRTAAGENPPRPAQAGACPDPRRADGGSDAGGSPRIVQ